MACLSTFIIGLIVLLIVYAIRKKDPKPIFGIYHLPGKWYYVKHVVFACLYYFRKHVHHYAAKKYMLRHLQTLCTAYLSDYLVPQNACGIYEFANFIEDKELEDKCLRGGSKSHCHIGITLDFKVTECVYERVGHAKTSWWSSKNSAAGKDGRAGQGVKALANAADMDRAHLLSDHAKAFDAVFFISATKNEDDKGIYVISGCERRPMGMCNGLFYIGLPGKGLLCSKKLPDTVLFGADVCEFGAEGIKMTPVEPMKKWTVSYKGQMWYQNEPSKLVDVDFKGEWTATTGHFDFDTDLHPAAVIRSIAREKWSREYFEGLKTAHQSHYEQFGVLNCNFKIGDESFEYTLPSFRDHSFGRTRDWSLMHRYAFHHIFLQNGSSISVGVICQPCTASLFEAGEIALPNGRILAIQWVDLRLHQHGEGGAAPRDYAFSFQAGDEVYTVQVLVEYEAIHYVSQDWEARMVERFCKFIVNGVPGRGVSEFHYRHKDGRPPASDDPEWYRTMRHEI